MRQMAGQGLRMAALMAVVLLGFATLIGTSGDSGDSTVTVTPDESGYILTPQSGSAFVEGDSVSFISSLANLSSSETYTYSWVSSVDGSIGTTASVTTTSLSADTHEVIFTVSDSSGNTVISDSVTITVGASSSSTETNTAPVADITAPTSTVTYNVGETVTFQGTGTDAEDGTLTSSSLVWSSSRDGAIGTGVSLSVDSLSQGEHTISLTVTDSDGSSSTAFIIITIGSSSSPPQVTITSPADNAEVQAGDTLNLVGSATDFDGTPITGTKLEWISSKDGSIGTGGTLLVDTRSVEALGYEPLTEGIHTIYLRASGSQETGQALVTLTLTNTNPTATIVNPPETCPTSNTLCKTFAKGEWLNLQGTATDDEDGDLSGDSLEWKSHLDGYLGSGEVLDINTNNVPALGGAAMTDGEHIIYLEAKDAWGAAGSDSIVISVGSNTPPVPSITYPTGDYTSGTSTGYITFYGRADDAEDGALTSDDMEWYSTHQEMKLTSQEPSGSGALSSSVRLDLSGFPSGTHTITLVATDSMGEKGVTSRNLTVP